MVRITKIEKDWLIAQGYLRIEGGRYNGLTVANREHINKSYYVTDWLARQLSKRYKNSK